jgi:hypothetical protein
MGGQFVAPTSQGPGQPSDANFLFTTCRFAIPICNGVTKSPERGNGCTMRKISAKDS